MRALITILDDTTETSMPFNEFVLYRANHYPDEKQILIICNSKSNLPKVESPQNIEIMYAGRKLKKIRKTICGVISDLKKQNIPYVVHMHQVQSGFLAEMSMIGTGFRKKSLFTVHSTFTGYKFHNKFLSFVNTFLARLTTCVSMTSYNNYPKFIRRIKGERIKAIQNGVDIERIDKILSATKPCFHEYVNFIYVARLIPLKNHEFLVDVLTKCNTEVRFTFVGAEDSGKTIRKKAEKLGVIDRITFTGLIPRNEVFQQLQNAEYYISSSTLEGLPVSVLEAMYCGLPCVLSNIPQHQEVAKNNATLLPYDVEKWAEELNRLAKLPLAERRELSQSIRQYVIDNFSLKAMHRNYDQVYELLLQG